MRFFALVLAVPLAACASVEERTDARSGSGFSTQSISGAQAPQATRQEVRMQGFEAVPVVRVAGSASSTADAAQMALAAGGAESGAWTTLSAGADTFDLRQVEVGAYTFAVADPSTRAGVTPDLLTQTSVRTGCKTTGQTWSANGRHAMALDCS